MRAGLILALFLSVPVSAESVFTLSEAAAITAHAADLGATEFCLGAKRCHELNPYLARFDDPVAFSVAKFSVVSLQLWAVRKLKDAGHPQLAAVTNFGIAAGFMGIAVRNQRVGR